MMEFDISASVFSLDDEDKEVLGMSEDRVPAAEGMRIVARAEDVVAQVRSADYSALSPPHDVLKRRADIQKMLYAQMALRFVAEYGMFETPDIEDFEG